MTTKRELRQEERRTAGCVKRLSVDDDYATLPIGDYAVLGNCETAALVSVRGGIEWLCLCRYDHPAVFAAILDTRRGGRLQVRPKGEYEVERWYLPGTAALQTEFRTPGGVVRITDVMPIYHGTDMGKQREAPALCRLIEGVKGVVEMEAVCDPRPDYARATPKLQRTEGAWVWSAGGQSVQLQTDLPLEPVAGDTSMRAEFHLSEGEARAIAIDDDARAVQNELVHEVRSHIESTVAWWRKWLEQLTYQGPYRGDVIRSAITLKLLCHGSSGAVVAAPTTSLPERIGGSWNWDYRFCWLRDASMTARALLRFGFADEAHAFMRWLVTSAQRYTRRLRVLYDVEGRHDIKETSLKNLRGYSESQPVRIGNAASRQLQFDSYGALVDAAYEFVLHGGKFTEKTSDVLRQLGHQACELWNQPDNGIWESRFGVKHHTLSKAMCWATLDRLVELNRRGALPGDVSAFAREKEKIRESINAHGVAEGGYYTVNYGEDVVDPSLLLLPLYGCEDARSDRMMRTLRKIDERLGPPPLLDRHVEINHLPPGDEGAFGIAGYWAVECLALAGYLDEAEERFEALLGMANDVGLMSEEVDRETWGQRGNFPQGYSHVGLLNAARALAEAQDHAAPAPGKEKRAEKHSV